MNLDSRYELGQDVYIANTLDKDVVFFGNIIEIGLYGVVSEDRPLPTFIYRISIKDKFDYGTLEQITKEHPLYSKYDGWATFASLEQCVFLTKDEIKTT